MAATTDADRTYTPGDTVHYEGAAEWLQPFTVAVVYHDGNLRLRDPYGYPIVSVDPGRVAPTGATD